ncbi:MAG: efflux RND transporter periplasmic adaptor subunit [Gemmatimonadaceae bacterium]
MTFRFIAGTAALMAVASCSSSTPEVAQAAPPRAAGTAYTVKDTTILATFDASGIAAPLQQSTLSTKLMGTVLIVSVHEGEMVSAGQALIRIDARDLAAKEGQVAASITGAVAMHNEATRQAGRIRALYADSAATKSQLDAAETELTRAESGVRAARAAAAELGAVSAYAIIRAPFTGTITRRFVDPGAFASPGAPLITIQDGRQLRITANATPDVARRVHRGQHVEALVEGRTVDAIVEGVVPAAAGNLYTINALVANPGGAILPGSTATLRLSLGARAGILVPTRALVREGDLVGVMLRTADGDRTRWIRAGSVYGTMTEVSSGLRAGDVVTVPVAPAGS